MNARRRRPSPALIISLVALFVSLGGTGYAAVKINGKNIKNKSISGKKLKTGTLTGRHIKNRSLAANDFKAGQLPAGAPGLRGAPGPTGPSTVYQARFPYDPSGPVLSNTAYGTLHTLNVPSGSYFITASIVANNSGNTGVFCDISSPGPSERFGETAPAGTTLSAGTSVAGRLPVGGSIKLSCIGNSASGTVRQAQSSLTAIKVGNVIGP